MHVPFKIHYRNNLIDKKDSYPIPRPPSVSVSNEILPIKAHLLDWSNKTQCYYIPTVNSIQHQSIYTSHVIYIVHIKLNRLKGKMYVGFAAY